MTLTILGNRFWLGVHTHVGSFLHNDQTASIVCSLVWRFLDTSNHKKYSRQHFQSLRCKGSNIRRPDLHSRLSLRLERGRIHWRDQEVLSDDFQRIDTHLGIRGCATKEGHDRSCKLCLVDSSCAKSKLLPIATATESQPSLVIMAHDMLAYLQTLRMIKPIVRCLRDVAGVNERTKIGVH